MSTKKIEKDQVQPTGDNVDQIREILFGSHIRAVDERFEIVEARLSRDNEKLRKELEQRIVELEKLLGQFRQDSEDQLSREGAERDAGLTAMSESIDAFRLESEKQLTKIQSEFSVGIKQVQKQLENANKAQTGELGSVQAAQEALADRLDDSKVDRGELAGFLSDIASRLTPSTGKRKK